MIITKEVIAQFKNRCVQRVISLGIEQAEYELFNGSEGLATRNNKLILLYCSLLFIGNEDSGYTDEQQDIIISYVSTKCDLYRLGYVDFMGLDMVNFNDIINYIGGGGGGGSGILLPILASDVLVMMNNTTTTLDLTIKDIYDKIENFTIKAIDGGYPTSDF